ncbi:MAG: FHA domain-containing protein [Anaerolineae bacterium]|nr:FHA domain-containing protein [Anaerolineae bacterium]
MSFGVFMTICPVCGHKNTVGEFFCAACGRSIVSTIEAPYHAQDTDSLICPACYTHNRPGSPACSHCGSPLADESPAPRAPASDSPEAVRCAPQAQSPGSTQVFGQEEPALYVQGLAAPVALSKAGETLLGRRDPSTTTLPTVDLNACGGYELGVSRKHATISYESGGFFLRDLGSTNGTFLNGRPLPAHLSFVLSSGDEIRLANLICHVYF